MAGLEVHRGLLDLKAAEAVLAIRDAMKKIDAIVKFLGFIPNVADTPDPLTLEPFNYTGDEAYLIRVVFQEFGTLSASVDLNATLDSARQLTGLE